jgi:hypothetical protein
MLSFTGKWMEPENIILSEVRLRGQKSCFLSYADYTPKTNAAILLGMGNTLRGDCKWEE